MALIGGIIGLQMGGVWGRWGSMLPLSSFSVVLEVLALMRKCVRPFLSSNSLCSYPLRRIGLLESNFKNR